MSWRGHRLGCGFATVLWLLHFALPASGELVVMTDGQVLKVESFERREDRFVLGLPGGGQLTISIERVDRILEDEIVEQPALTRGYAVGDLELWFEDTQAVPDTPFGDLIYATSRRHEVNPVVVAAMVRAESNFDPRAVSPKGAMGLLQLMPATATRFGLERARVFEPEANLEAGVRYFRWLAERFAGDLVLALAGYNAGEAMVDRHEGVPPFRETDTYIQRVLEFAVGTPEGR